MARTSALVSATVHGRSAAVGENLKTALALFAGYNFCRIHRSIGVSPATEPGIADNIWTVGELLYLGGL